MHNHIYRAESLHGKVMAIRNQVKKLLPIQSHQTLVLTIIYTEEEKKNCEQKKIYLNGNRYLNWVPCSGCQRIFFFLHETPIYL